MIYNAFRVSSKTLTQKFGQPIYDIYTQNPVDAFYEIDHFLPWSFVVHDEFWNLCPVRSDINRSKADHVPAVDPYLMRLSQLHAPILAHPKLPQQLGIAYGEFLGVPIGDLRSINLEVVVKKVPIRRGPPCLVLSERS